MPDSPRSTRTHDVVSKMAARGSSAAVGRASEASSFAHGLGTVPLRTPNELPPAAVLDRIQRPAAHKKIRQRTDSSLPGRTCQPRDVAWRGDGICEICEAARITEWHHEDDICWVAD